MLTARQRAILLRIHRLHQLIWLLLVAALALPIVMLATWSASLAPQTAVGLAIATGICVTMGVNTICPKCGGFFHSGRGIVEVFTERCKSCGLSCRDPDADDKE